MLAGVIVVAVAVRGGDWPGSPGPGATASGAIATASPAQGLAASPTSSPTLAPTPTTRPTPLRTPAPTAPPRATGDPRLAYAEFLLRVNDDRAKVEGLNRTLAAAAQAQDLVAVRTASVAILDFIDGERDWLREHPPADCYAAAHASATKMLEAYGTAADTFIKWAATGGGLDGLTALGDALDAADAAGAALTAFGKVLETTSCAT